MFAYSEARVFAIRILRGMGYKVSTSAGPIGLAKLICDVSGICGARDKATAKRTIVRFAQSRATTESAKVFESKKQDKSLFEQTPAFLRSREWKAIRYRALVLHGGRCQCCGASAKDGARLNVDHIKPRSKYPELALDLNNLQVLCSDCNAGKSNVDQTDWREIPTQTQH